MGWQRLHNRRAVSLLVFLLLKPLLTSSLVGGLIDEYNRVLDSLVARNAVFIGIAVMSDVVARLCHEIEILAGVEAAWPAALNVFPVDSELLGRLCMWFVPNVWLLLIGNGCNRQDMLIIGHCGLLSRSCRKAEVRGSVAYLHLLLNVEVGRNEEKFRMYALRKLTRQKSACLEKP